MRTLAIFTLISLFLLAKLPPILAVPIALAGLWLVGYFVYGVLVGIWRLLYYGGRNQRDKAKL
jgi:hypothetical protein